MTTYYLANRLDTKKGCLDMVQIRIATDDWYPLAFAAIARQ